MEYKRYIEGRYWQHVLSFPFIWAVLVPLICFDVMLELYHRVCFPLYGLEFIDRDTYIKIDRYKLHYLDWTDKINCAYCGYANGLLSYAQAIAGRTEAYWCGIKHQSSAGFHEPSHHNNFVEYNDQSGFEEKYLEDDNKESERASKKITS